MEGGGEQTDIYLSLFLPFDPLVFRGNEGGDEEEWSRVNSLIFGSFIFLFLNLFLHVALKRINMFPLLLKCPVWKQTNAKKNPKTPNKNKTYATFVGFKNKKTLPIRTPSSAIILRVPSMGAFKKNKGKKKNKDAKKLK